MGEKEDIIKGLKAFKNASGVDMERLIFFGSRARGKPGKDSDIDLVVVSNAFKGVKCCRGERLYRNWVMPYPVDFMCYTPEEFNMLSKRVSIVSEALKEGIAI